MIGPLKCPAKGDLLLYCYGCADSLQPPGWLRGRQCCTQAPRGLQNCGILQKTEVKRQRHEPFKNKVFNRALTMTRVKE